MNTSVAYVHCCYKVSVSGKHWHGYCFRCKVCDQDMAGKPAIPRDDGAYHVTASFVLPPFHPAAGICETLAAVYLD